MPIYREPTKILIAHWADSHLKPGQSFRRSDVCLWFSEQYPKIKRNTVKSHVDGMSTNNPNRKHHPRIKPGSGHDLFYKLGPDEFRLWNQESDPSPLYKLLARSPPEDVVQPETQEVAEETGQLAHEPDCVAPAATIDIAEKTLALMKKNLTAVADHATRLANAKNFQETVRLQTEFIKSQYEAATNQFKEWISGVDAPSGEASDAPKK